MRFIVADLCHALGFTAELYENTPVCSHTHTNTHTKKKKTMSIKCSLSLLLCLIVVI